MYSTEITRKKAVHTANLSWRTGPRAKNSVPVPSPHQLGTRFDRGSLVDKLSARKKYIDLVDANLASFDGGRTLSTDSGHTYTKIVKSLGGSGGWYRLSPNGSSVPRTDVAFCVQEMGYIPSFISNIGGIASYTVPTGMSVVPYEQRSINSAAASMVPGAPLPIAETILELLKGDLPSLLKSFQKNLSRFERLQAAGGDYLSIQFAWKPVAQDLFKVINTLMGADHVLHGTSFRRSREISSITVSSERSRNVTATPFSQGFLSTGGTMYGNGFYEYMTHTMSHVIKAKLNTGIRPTRRQYGFYDKAIDVLSYLGFDQPSLGWQLSSWSWLVDWAVDIGTSIDNFANFSMSGRYPMDYSYISTKSKATRMCRPLGQQYYYRRLPGNGFEESYRGSAYAECFAFERKPLPLFRPGFSLNGLSSFQYSILVALGLAKTR